MKKRICRLSDTQLEVMQAVWTCTAPATRADIEDILFLTHPMAMTTLLTLLTRLTEKGFVTVEQKSHKNYYTPCITEVEYIASQSRNFYEKLCRRNLSVFANALCASGLSRDEIAQLRTLLDEDQ